LAINLYDRCNRWMLYSGLSNGLAKVSFVTLWMANRDKTADSRGRRYGKSLEAARFDHLSPDPTFALVETFAELRVMGFVV
jgi:hypothetical protein